MLVKAVCEDIPDAKGQPASNLLKSIKELFGRVTSKVLSLSMVHSLLRRRFNFRQPHFPHKSNNSLSFVFYTVPNWKRGKKY